MNCLRRNKVGWMPRAASSSVAGAEVATRRRVDVASMYLYATLLMAYSAGRLWDLSTRGTLGLYAVLAAIFLASLALPVSTDPGCPHVWRHGPVPVVRLCLTRAHDEGDHAHDGVFRVTQ